MLLGMMSTMASCMGDSSTEITLYDDAAITAFSLGTLNRITHTTASDGTDSVITTTYTGGNYRFNIDQVNRLIFNTDSLPLGTDVAHVLCNISTRNNSVAYYFDTEEKDKFYLYSSDDSIDFTTPREFIIFSSDGLGSTRYTIKVNAHQQDGDEFVWERIGTGYTPVTPPTPPSGIKTIIGTCMAETYALSDDNKLMVSKDNGQTWQEEILDSDAAMLPTTDLSFVTYDMPLADNTYHVVLAGNRDEQLYADDCAMVWRKIVDITFGAPKSNWVFIDRQAEKGYKLPNMKNLNIVRYDDSILAFGKPYDKIYQSRDNGITWKENSLYKMPEGFDTNATAIKVEVKDNIIYIYCEGTGEIWKGKLNRLTWDSNN